MKIRKLMAALLCAAVAVTSPGINTFAAETGGSETGDVLLVETKDEIVSDSVQGSVVEEPVSVNASEGTEDMLVFEDEAQDEVVDKVTSDDYVVSAPESEIAGEEPEPVNYSASDCFDQNSTTLQFAPGKGGKVSDYTSTPVIPKKVEVIPAGFFEGDSGLDYVYFEDGSKLTTIEEDAFKGSSIKVFTAPDGYTTIEPSTFENCKNLIGFSFKNVTSIGDSAFAGCINFGSDMTQFAGGSKVTEIGQRAFANTGFITLDLSKFSASEINVGAGAFEQCGSLKTATIPAGFTSIPNNCFSECKLLTTITLGKKVSSIGKNAFDGCKNLTTVNFNLTDEDISKVERVGDYAFKSCEKLKTITFPKACIEFGDYLFHGCTALIDVYFSCRGDSGLAEEFTIGENAFGGLSAVTVHGYDGTVLEYCTRKSIKYKSMNATHSVKLGKGVQNAFCECMIGQWVRGKDKPNVPVGSKVYFTLYIKDGFYLVDRVWDSEDDKLNIDYVSGSGKQIIFSFDMPDHDVVLQATQVTKALFDLLPLTYSIGQYNEDILYYPTEDGYRTEKTGNRGLLSVRLQGTVNNVKYDYGLGEWNTQFSSSNTKVAVFDPDKKGLITAKGSGDTTITAQAIPNGKYVRFTLSVDRSVELGSIEFDEVTFINHPGKDPGDAYLDSEDYIYDEEPDAIKHIYRIQYMKDELASYDRKFKIRFKALDTDDGDMYVTANWTVTNSNIATLAQTVTNDNYNTITVKKDSVGTVTIKASYNTGKKYQDGSYKGKPIIRSAYAILQIIDPAPTTASSLRINKQRNLKEKDAQGNYLPESQQNYGAEIPIVANSEYPVASISETIYKKNKSTNSYVVFNGVKLVDTGKVKDGIPQYRLYVTEYDKTVNALALNKELDFSGDNKLYIRGTFEDAEMGDFYTPIEKLVIFNQKPEPKFTKAGVINTFYNSSCYDISALDYIMWDDIMGKDTKKTPENVDKYAAATIGTVYLGQSIGKSAAEVDYERSMIVDDDNYARYMINKKESAIIDTTAKPDRLRNNFVLLPNPDSENNFMIRRTAKEMKTNDKGQEINMGYIFVYYKGYKEPYITKLKVDTKYAVPTFNMTQKSANASVLSGAADFKFKFLSKKTNEPAFTDSNVDSFITLQKLSSTGVFVNPVPAEDGYWKLTMNSNSAGKKTAVMQLKLKNWDKSLNCSFVVNVTDTKPNAKLTRPTVNVNSHMTGEEAIGESVLVISHSDAEASVDSIEFAGAAKLEDEASKLSISVDPGDYPNQAKIRVEITDDTILRGNYRFKITPRASYPSGATSQTNPKELFLNVAVADSQPVLKLNTATVTFNLDYPDCETQKLTIASVAGMPAGIVGAEIKETSGMVVDFDPTFTFAGNLKNETLVQDAECIIDALSITCEKKKNEKTNKWYYEIAMKLAKPSAQFSGAALNMPFTVSGIKVNGAEVKPFRFTIKSTRNAPVIAVGATGGINSVDPSTNYKITLSVKNLVNPEINNLTVLKFDDDANEYVEDDQFYVEKDEDLDTIWYLYANHALDDDPETRFKMGKHEIFLQYTLADKEFRTKALTPSGTQSLPKITQDLVKAVFYSHQDVDDRSTTYTITKASVLKSHIADVKISDGNISELKNAFEIEYNDLDDDEDARMNMKSTTKTWKAGEITLKCVDPSQLTSGRTYTLKLEAIMDGQFYKRDNKGELVLDDYGNPVLTSGQTISIQVVVQK